MRQIPHFFVSGSQYDGVFKRGYAKIREHELHFEVEEKRHRAKADVELLEVTRNPVLSWG
jgi:hypothetical protein